MIFNHFSRSSLGQRRKRYNLRRYVYIIPLIGIYPLIQRPGLSYTNNLFREENRSLLWSLSSLDTS